MYVYIYIYIYNLVGEEDSPVGIIMRRMNPRITSEGDFVIKSNGLEEEVLSKVVFHQHSSDISKIVRNLKRAIVYVSFQWTKFNWIESSIRLYSLLISICYIDQTK